MDWFENKDDENNNADFVSRIYDKEADLSELMESDFSNKIIMAACFETGLLNSENYANFKYGKNILSEIDILDVICYYCPEFYSILNYEQKCDCQLIKTVLEQKGGMLNYVPKHIAEKKEMIELAIMSDAFVLFDLPYDEQLKIENIIFAIRQDKMVYLELPEYFQKDYEIAREALLNKGINFNIIHDSLKEDKEFLLICLDYNELLFKQLSEKMKKDEEIISVALFHDPELLSQVNIECRTKDICKIALRKKGLNNYILPLIPEQYFEDKAFVMEISKQCLPFNYLKELKNDKDVVLKMIKFSEENNKYERMLFLRNVNVELRKDEEIIDDVLKINADNIIIFKEYFAYKRNIKKYINKEYFKLSALLSIFNEGVAPYSDELVKLGLTKDFNITELFKNNDEFSEDLSLFIISNLNKIDPKDINDVYCKCFEFLNLTEDNFMLLMASWLTSAWSQYNISKSYQYYAKNKNFNENYKDLFDRDRDIVKKEVDMFRLEKILRLKVGELKEDDKKRNKI